MADVGVRCQGCGAPGRFASADEAFVVGWQRVTVASGPSTQEQWFCPREPSSTVRQVLEAAGASATHEGRILE